MRVPDAVTIVDNAYVLLLGTVCPLCCELCRSQSESLCLGASSRSVLTRASRGSDIVVGMKEVG